MARTQTVTDDEIMTAARHVMRRKGFDAFTLSDVAAEVGLSRAAIILRFQSTQALRSLITAKVVSEFVSALEKLPITKGGDGLIELARYIGSLAGGAQGAVVNFMARLRASAEDPQLAELEAKRIAAYEKAIRARMPKTLLSEKSAALAFQAHLGGSLLRLENLTGVNAADYLEERTKEWLRLARIPFTVRAAKAPAPRRIAAKRTAKS